MASPYAIRIVGDPVLRQRVGRGDRHRRAPRASSATTCSRRCTTRPAWGSQRRRSGVQKRFFVYDLGAGDGGQVLINPVMTESDGEWEFHEGCLSVPGMSLRHRAPQAASTSPGSISTATTSSFEADELFARLIQHELDHLDGVLLLEHLDDEQRREAKKALRERAMAAIRPTCPEDPSEPPLARSVSLSAHHGWRPREARLPRAPPRSPWRRSAALHAAGHEIVAGRVRARQAPGPRGAPAPSPVKAAALELGLEVTDDPDDRARPRRRAGRGGGLRPAPAAPPAGGAAHGEPALLPVAPLAGCCAGRAGHPRRRRRSPGCA